MPPQTIRDFSSFICIDWSGALGERQAGIAVAQIGREGPPSLIKRDKHWSRQEILNWLLELSQAEEDVLIGFDLSFGLPFADHGCYFPQWPQSPPDARALWQLVDSLCTADAHLSAPSFLAHPQAHRHFRHAKGDIGDLFEGSIGRLRLVESHQRATKQANSWSCFNLVGAGQVGKSSLTGMRLLHRLSGRIPIWPFDPLPQSGPAIVEIYTSMAARAAGMPAGRSKIGDKATLDAALAALNAPPPPSLPKYDDHSTDALITAAWMRGASKNAALWRPKLLSEKICQTEGWTFGVN